MPKENFYYLIYADDGFWGKFWHVGLWSKDQFICDGYHFTLENVTVYYPLDEMIAIYRNEKGLPHE